MLYERLFFNLYFVTLPYLISFQVKEVAPNTADSKATAKFWKNDLQVRIIRLVETSF